MTPNPDSSLKPTDIALCTPASSAAQSGQQQYALTCYGQHGMVSSCTCTSTYHIYDIMHAMCHVTYMLSALLSPTQRSRNEGLSLMQRATWLGSESCPPQGPEPPSPADHRLKSQPLCEQWRQTVPDSAMRERPTHPRVCVVRLLAVEHKYRGGSPSSELHTFTHEQIIVQMHSSYCGKVGTCKGTI